VGEEQFVPAEAVGPALAQPPAQPGPTIMDAYAVFMQHPMGMVPLENHPEVPPAAIMISDEELAGYTGPWW
jgi:hypothetical protein